MRVKRQAMVAGIAAALMVPAAPALGQAGTDYPPPSNPSGGQKKPPGKGKD